MPTISNTLTKYPDQPLATVAAPRVNSSIRSHPIIQAINSLNVAYERKCRRCRPQGPGYAADYV